MALAILIMGFLEVVGVASILPFMQLMAEPNPLQESRWLKMAFEYFNFESAQQMILYLGGFLLVLFFVTNAFSVFATWLQYRISWNVAHKLGTRLLRTYLQKPYNFYLTSNTAQIQTYIISEVSSLTGGVLVPLIEIFSRSLVSLVILGILIMVDPKIALIMFVGLGSSFLLIYLSQKNYLKRIGQERIDMNLIRFKSSKEVFDGIKTVMVNNKRDFFYDRYHYASEAFSNIQPKYNLILAIPRGAIEFVTFSSILIITMHLYNINGSVQHALPRLSLYAVAGYRLLPALQKVFASFAKLKHNFPVVETLYKDLVAKTSTKNDVTLEPTDISFNHSLKLNQLQFHYGDPEDLIIKNLSIDIQKGQTIAFVGSTGSGKTTLVDLIVGLLFPTNGAIELDGTALSPSNIMQWQRQLAYVPQEVFLFDDTVINNLTLGGEKIDHQRLKKVTQLADIHDFIINNLNDGFDSKIGEKGVRLSGGQRQRLGLARALYSNPSVLVLDEATSALDSITEQNIIESLKTLPNDLTTIIIAHRLSTVKHADCIYVLKEGRVAAKGTYESLIHSNESFKTMVKLS